MEVRNSNNVESLWEYHIGNKKKVNGERVVLNCWRGFHAHFTLKFSHHIWRFVISI